MSGHHLTWADVELITGGKLGRNVHSPCPFCSHSRRQSNQRKPVFAVLLKEPDFAVYNCAHCGASGYVHPDRASHPIDLSERKRLREEAALREREDMQRRTEAALKIWDDRQPFANSPADTYLRRGRCIGDWLDSFDLEASLGFHPSVPFGGERAPCMLALIRNIVSNEPQAVHRTAIDAAGKKLSHLGANGRLSFGPVGGGAVKLSDDSEVTGGLLIGEGIETVLSASRHLKFRPCWSVLSRSGIAKFPVLSGIECITIAVDNDESGDGQRDAAALVERLVAAGVEAITTKTNLCKDFNDALLRGLKS